MPALWGFAVASSKGSLEALSVAQLSNPLVHDASAKAGGVHGFDPGGLAEAIADKVRNTYLPRGSVLQEFLQFPGVIHRIALGYRSPRGPEQPWARHTWVA